MAITLSQYVRVNKGDILRNMAWQCQRGTPVEAFFARKLLYLHGLGRYGVEFDIEPNEAFRRIFNRKLPEGA